MPARASTWPAPPWPTGSARTLRRLYIARDADAAGDVALAALTERAEAAGIEALALSPRMGDFNEDLRAFGLGALGAALRIQLASQDVVRFMLFADAGAVWTDRPSDAAGNWADYVVSLPEGGGLMWMCTPRQRSRSRLDASPSACAKINAGVFGALSSHYRRARPGARQGAYEPYSLCSLRCLQRIRRFPRPPRN